MILLVLAKTGGHFEKSVINTKRTTIFIHSLPTVNYLIPRGETLFHLPPINILEMFKDFSPTTRKYSKTFHLQPETIQRLFCLQNCLSRKTSAPGNFQKFFRLQNCLSRKSSLSRKYSKIFRPAATSKSNQQQQPAKAISSSDQQKQAAAATDSSNQPQQPAAAINSSNQQQQPATATSIHLASRTYTINADLRQLSLWFLAKPTPLAVDLGLAAR